MSRTSAVVTLLALAAAPVQAATLRCRNTLVSDGASMGEVQSKCGPPDASHSRTFSVRQAIAPDQDLYEEVQVDTWFYDFGSHRFTQEVVFWNGRVKEVNSGKYGVKPDGAEGAEP